MESLNKIPDFDADSIDIKNPDSVKDLEIRFQAYEQKGKVHKKTEGFLKDHLSKELGIELRDSDLQDVESYFDEALINDPEYINKVAQQFEEYESMKKELAEQEKIFGQLKDQAELRKQHTVALEISDSGWKAKLGNYLTGSLDEKAVEFKLNITNIQEELVKIGTELSKSENTENRINEIKDKIAQFKLNLFEQVDADKKIGKYVARKSVLRLGDQINYFDISWSDKKSLDTLIGVKDKLSKMNKYDQNLKDEYFSEFASEAQVESLIEQIDIKLQKALAKEVQTVVAGVEKTTSYTQMEKGLEDLMSLQKVGDMERDEVHAFIKEGLQHEIDTGNLQPSSKIFINTYMANHLSGV